MPYPVKEDFPLSEEEVTDTYDRVKNSLSVADHDKFLNDFLIKKGFIPESCLKGEGEPYNITNPWAFYMLTKQDGATTEQIGEEISLKVLLGGLEYKLQMTGEPAKEFLVYNGNKL